MPAGSFHWVTTKKKKKLKSKPINYGKYSSIS